MMLPLEFPEALIASPRELELRTVHSVWIDQWIAERHYLGYSPPGARLRIAVYHGGRVVGGMLFGRPVARMIEQRTTLELTRMYLLDECPRNSESRSLGVAVRLIRKLFPDVSQLIAYSDPAYGHSGTIYRAAGWTLDGLTEGKKWTPRNDGYSRRNKATGSKMKWVKRL